MSITLENTKVLVIGMGLSGLSALQWLLLEGADVAMADTRKSPPNLKEVKKIDADIKMHLGPMDAALLQSFELIVVSPGVALSEPAIAQAINAGVPVVGDVELFAQFRPKSAKLIAVTGSNGKSTVVTMVGEICKEAGLNTVVAGNIGLPVLDVLREEKLTGEVPDVYVLELSSFQLETTKSLFADAATVLNVSEDHMDRYEDIDAYAQAKARIYKHADVAVVNGFDQYSAIGAEGNVVLFGFDQPENITDFGIIENGETWLASGKRKYLQVSDLKVAGNHNVLNALAASALCRALTIETKYMVNTLKAFGGLPHRVQWIASIEDVDYYDDSKGTNVGATCAAINGMARDDASRKVVLIAGGEGKGQDFSPLIEPVANNARAVVLIGRDAKLIEAILLPTNVPMYEAVDLSEAVVIAQKMASKNDAVLLSPACASFDMFDNYQQRGQQFAEAVNALEMVTC